MQPWGIVGYTSKGVKMSNDDQGRKKMKAPELIYKKSWIGAILVLLLLCCAHYAAAQDTDTWQLFAAIGYRFSWGDIRMGYRHLSYEMDDEFLMQDMDLSGPVLGVGFRF